jgi:hypothetical protein
MLCKSVIRDLAQLEVMGKHWTLVPRAVPTGARTPGSVKKGMRMAKTGLLPAVCSIAILAASPAFAQTNMPTGDAPAGAPNNRTMPMTPADKMGASHGPMGEMGSHPEMDRHSGHRVAMGAMHGRSEASQNAAVDQLNEQSYQAARSGQAFNGVGSGAVTAPSASGRMNDMQGGSMSHMGGDGGGSGGGSGM